MTLVEASKHQWVKSSAINSTFSVSDRLSVKPTLQHDLDIATQTSVTIVYTYMSKSLAPTGRAGALADT